MDNLNITDAYIQHVSDTSKIPLNNLFLDFKNLQHYPYLLIVRLKTEEFIKLTIYPIKKEKITKVSLRGANLSDTLIEQLTRILQEFHVIHTSGFLLIKNQLFYECYLNLSLSEKKYIDLKASLHKIKNIFKEIRIEEIGLKKA